MKHLNAITGGDHLAALESHTTTIACEGFNLADLSNRGRDFVMSVVDTGSKTFSKVSSDFSKITQDIVDKARDLRFTNFYATSKYNQVMHLRVPCPEGFKGDVLEYTEVLVESVQQARRVQSEVLIPLEDFLSKLISVPGFARDTRTHLRNIDKIAIERVETVRKTQKFFGGSSKANALFSELYRNMGEWQTAYENVRKLQDNIGFINHEEILKSIDRITSLIQMVKTAHEAKELENMSKVVISELSNTVYEAAKQVEQLGITIFAIYVLANTMSQTAEKI